MLNLLQSNTDKLQVITSAAGTIDVDVAYVDFLAGSPPTITPSGASLQITTATTTDIVATPSTAGTIRNVKGVRIFNRDAALPNLVTIQASRGASPVLRQIWSEYLRPGEALILDERGNITLLTPITDKLLMKALAADDTGGQNINTVQPWFPTAGAGSIAIGTYRMEGLLAMTHGGTTHTTGLSFGGTAGIANIDYMATCLRATDGAIGTGYSAIRIGTVSNTVLEATSTATGTLIRVEGLVRVNAAGTIIPQFTHSAATGTAPTIKRNSYIRFTGLGDASFTTLGTWS